MNKEKLKQTLLKRIEEIQQRNNNSIVTFDTQTELIDGVKCKAKIRQFEIDIDEPESLGGEDTAPNPVELVLAALGTCQEILYSAYSAVLGIPIDSVKVDVIGTLDLKGFFGLDSGVNPGLQKVSYKTTITSKAKDSEIRKLIEVVEKNCPVLDTLKRPVIVEGQIKTIISTGNHLKPVEVNKTNTVV